MVQLTANHALTSWSRSYNLLATEKQGSLESLSKFPGIAVQLEVVLYRDAPSFQEYTDLSTLKQRLQHIAVEVSRQTRCDQSDNADHNPEPSQDQHQPPPPLQLPNPCASYYLYSPNPSVNVDPNGMIASIHRQNGSHATLAEENGSTDQPGVVATSSTDDQKPDDDAKKIKKLEAKQHRLYLLQHSSTCPHKDGRCSVTRHCAEMQRLWLHMARCKDNTCKFPHCHSSRYIVGHFRKCRDTKCPVCGPTRETVKRNRALRSMSSRTLICKGPMMNLIRNATDEKPQMDSMDDSASVVTYKMRNPPVSMQTPVQGCSP